MVNTRNKPCPCGSGEKYKNCCLKHKDKYTIYCDESGNSGSNYLDFEQPFYIIAGWIVPNKNVDKISKIRDCAVALGVEGELHGTKLIKRKKAQKEFLKLFDILSNEIECIPTFIIAEKKYCIAAKIIETILDPMYNDEVDNSYTYDNLKKKRLVEILYNFLPDQHLSEFILSYNEANSTRMGKCIINICNFLDSTNEKDLSKKLMGGLKCLEDNLQSEKNSHESLPNKTMMSLNVPTYVAYISLLEKVGRMVNGSFTLIHDKTKQFEESYNELFSLFSSKPENHEFPLSDGNSILIGFNHLKEFSFADSKENEWIQASDILASVLGRVLKTIYCNESLNEELFNLAKPVLPLLLVDDMKLAESICSDVTRTKIYRALLNKTES